MTRAVAFRLLVALLVVAAAAPGGAVAAGSGVQAASPSASPVSDASSAPAAADSAPTLTQRVTFVRDPEPNRVTATVAYDVPRSVEELTVTVPSLAAETTSLASTAAFHRRNETTFEWTGGSRSPTLTLHVAVGNASFGVSDRGVEGDGWAFAVEPATAVSWRYYGTTPVYRERLTVDGEGYTRDHLAYMGPYDEATVRTADERTTFVVSTVGGNDASDVSRLSSFLTVANEHFDFGVHRESVTVFVLPIETTDVDHLEGATIGTSMWVTANSLALDSQGDAFPHEYVHTRLGVVGRGSAGWLTEATATYYGHAFALNYGVGSFEAFHESMTAERFAADREGVVLTDRTTWEGTLADYQKGAHVLAALDAEIRRRTDGRHTLREVYADAPFESYREFRTAVVDVAGDDSLGAWLDRYATTTALPTLPDDPALYVYGGTLDPDEDGLQSERELDAGTNPFVADTDGDGLDDGSDPNPLTAATATPATASKTAATKTTVPAAESSASPTATTTADGRGFGVVAAGAAVALAAALTYRRRR